MSDAAVQFLQIEPTTRCNFTCGFCAGRHMPQTDLTLERFEQALKLYPALTCVEIQGEGEPLLHPQFFDMVAAAQRQNVRAHFITNGSLFSEETVDKLLSFDNVDKLYVSVESVDPKAFREIRGGSFEKVRAGVERLQAKKRALGKSRPAVGLTVTVMRRTQGEASAIAELYRALGLDGGVLVQLLQKKGDYTQHYDSEMAAQVFSDEEAMMTWGLWLGDDNLAPILHGPKDVPGFHERLFDGWDASTRTCPWLERGAYVSCDGSVTGCCKMKEPQFAFGSLGDDPARMQLLRDQVRAAFKAGQVPAHCDGCGTADIIRSQF